MSLPCSVVGYESSAGSTALVSRGRLALVRRQGAVVVCWCTGARLHGARLRWCMRE